MSQVRTGPMSLGQVQELKLKLLVYGNAGVGKTIFCSGTNFRTLVFDVDDGMSSAKAFRNKNGLSNDSVHVWPIQNMADFTAAFTYLVNNIQYYDLVVVDTATELQQVILEDARQRAKTPIATQQEWGAVLLQLEQIARSFRHLPVHVVWTAHEVEALDEQYRRNMYRPNFQGQFGKAYSKHFSGIFRYCIFEQQVAAGAEGKLQTITHRLIQTNRDQFVTAKDRSMALEPYEAPDLQAIITKMLTAISTNPQLAAEITGE